MINFHLINFHFSFGMYKQQKRLIDILNLIQDLFRTMSGMTINGSTS